MGECIYRVMGEGILTGYRWGCTYRDMGKGVLTESWVRVYLQSHEWVYLQGHVWGCSYRVTSEGVLTGSWVRVYLQSHGWGCTYRVMGDAVLTETWVRVYSQSHGWGLLIGEKKLNDNSYIVKKSTSVWVMFQNIWKPEVSCIACITAQLVVRYLFKVVCCSEPLPGSIFGFGELET